MPSTSATLAFVAIATVICSCESHPTKVVPSTSYTCDASTSSPSLDEMTPYGFTMADVLPLVSGKHDATLTWHSSRDLQVSQVGTTTLHLEVAPRIDEVTLQSGCGTYLYLPTDISLATDDGALAEHRPATFEVTSKNVLRIILFLYSRGSIWAPAGALQVVYTGTAAWDVESLTMDISFDSSGTRGNVEYSAYNSPASVGDAATSISTTVATWIPKVGSDATAD